MIENEAFRDWGNVASLGRVDHLLFKEACLAHDRSRELSPSDHKYEPLQEGEMSCSCGFKYKVKF